MNSRVCKALRKRAEELDTSVAVLVRHEGTGQVRVRGTRQIYKALKKMYKPGMDISSMVPPVSMLSSKNSWKLTVLPRFLTKDAKRFALWNRRFGKE